MKKKTDKKVVLFGIDGADWHIISRLIKENKLPYFSQLKKNGLLTKLMATIPPSSPPGWNSIFSGVEPGRHGIYDFVKVNPRTCFIEPVSSYDRKAPLLWDMLTDANRKTVAVNIPFVYPQHKVNGVVITGLGAPSKNDPFVSDPKVQDYLLKKYPRYDVDFSEQEFDIVNHRDEVLRRVDELSPIQWDVARDLYSSQSWDVFIFVIRQLDVVQHYFFDKPKILERYYIKADEMLGWFQSNMDKNTALMLCSDHGFQSVKISFSISTWLKTEGYLSIKKPKSSMLTINAEKVEQFLKSVGLGSLVWHIKRSKYLHLLLKFVAESKYHGVLTKIQWGNTKIYHVGTTNGLLYFNRQDREAYGIVEPIQSYKLYHEVRRKLLKLRYKGKKVVQSVVYIDDIYPAATQIAPDILITLHKDFLITGGISEKGVLFSIEKKFKGDHGMDGVVGLLQKYNKQKIKHEEPTLVDIVPTMLKLLNIKEKVHIDGKSIV